MSTYVINASVVFKIFPLKNGIESEEEIFKKAENRDIRYPDIKLITSFLIWVELKKSFLTNSTPKNDMLHIMGNFRQQADKELIKIFPASNEILKKSVELMNLDTNGQGKISIYDATFHALAILENVIFLTTDEKYVRKTQKLIGSVELFE